MNMYTDIKSTSFSVDKDELIITPNFIMGQPLDTEIEMIEPVSIQPKTTKSYI